MVFDGNKGRIESSTTQYDQPEGSDRNNLVALLEHNTPEKISYQPGAFEKVLPDYAKALKEKGVQEITVTPGAQVHRIEAKSKGEITVDRDPPLLIGTDFSCDLQKSPDGTITINNISGMAATAFGFKLPVLSIEFKKTADGKTEIHSKAQGKFRVREKTEVEADSSTYDQLNQFIDDMKKKKQAPNLNKQTGQLEIPSPYPIV